MNENNNNKYEVIARYIKDVSFEIPTPETFDTLVGVDPTDEVPGSQHLASSSAEDQRVRGGWGGGSWRRGRRAGGETAPHERVET